MQAEEETPWNLHWNQYNSLQQKSFRKRFQVTQVTMMITEIIKYKSTTIRKAALLDVKTTTLERYFRMLYLTDIRGEPDKEIIVFNG